MTYFHSAKRQRQNVTPAHCLLLTAHWNFRAAEIDSAPPL